MLRFATRGGAAFLTFELAADRGWPYRVRITVDADPNALSAAERQASRLVAGARVHVPPRSDQGIAVLELLDVFDVIT